jgi:hypothetical protein
MEIQSDFSAAVADLPGRLLSVQSRPPGGEFTDITGETSPDLVVHDIVVSGLEHPWHGIPSDRFR